MFVIVISAIFHQPRGCDIIGFNGTMTDQLVNPKAYSDNETHEAGYSYPRYYRCYDYNNDDNNDY